MSLCESTTMAERCSLSARCHRRSSRGALVEARRVSVTGAACVVSLLCGSAGVMQVSSRNSGSMAFSLFIGEMIYHKDTKTQRKLKGDTLDAVFKERHVEVDEQAEPMTGQF